MCHHCVVESVKERMLNRRDLFRGAAAVTAAATVGAAVSATPAVAAAVGKPVDMTHELHEKFPTFFGEQTFFSEQKFNYKEHKFNLFEIRLNEHTGTHLDAPLHFSENGQSVAEVPIENLVAPLAIIDIREKAAASADAQVTPDDIKAWISKNGPLPERCCVAMNSGWDTRVSGEEFRNVGADEKMHFPGFHIEATKMLIEEASVVGMAVDTLSLDYGLSADFATHYEWLPTNRWGLECTANLSQLPAAGATIFVGAPKHRGGSGGPSRVMALV
ncbi:cyclase family protein [hydrothermal vent metagenome]|uniref:Cyclase family protein n=1 Tax=hydrothermal vent metagenome TaxID=652676 RepID=A0A3B0TK26_9ZZZZ